MTGKAVRLALAAALIGSAGIGLSSASSAQADTQCNQGINAGIIGDNATVGYGTYYAWCHPNGGTVSMRLALICPDGPPAPWSISATASGSGNGTIYTDEVSCWLGQTAQSAQIIHG